MLRYVERVGLVEPDRSAAGYRLYGPAELQRLRTLRELLDEHDIGLSDLAFALRLRREGELRQATDAWLEAEAAASRRRPGVRLAALRAGEAPAAARRAGAPHTHPHPGDRMTAHHDARLQGRRHRPRRLRPQGDPARRARDARPDVDARRVRRRAAAQGRAHHRLAAHDDPDRRADRDARCSRRRGPLGLLQHLLDAGSRRGGHRRGRHPGLRLEGRDARGVLVVHRAGAHVAGRRRPEHDPRRRWRRHAARPPRRRVRGGRRGAGPRDRRQRRAPDHPRDAHAHARRGPAEVDPHGRRDQGRDRGDHDRRPPPLPVRHARASCCSRRSTSTTRSPSRSSTTSTAAATR